jgi:hypothetical protein
VIGSRARRWQRAKSDARGFRDWKPDIAVLALGGFVSFAVLVVLGFPGETQMTEAVVAGSAIAAVLVLRLINLAWCWHRAPERLLQDEVYALRHALGSHETPVIEPHGGSAQVRVWILDAIRRGEAMVRPGEGIYEREVEDWTADVRDYLLQHGTPEEAEQFVTAQGWLAGRIDALKEIAAARDQT